MPPAFEMLKYCDISREIVETTGFPTPLGEVVLVRARSDGNVQLAGPSITAQLAKLSGMFFALGADVCHCGRCTQPQNTLRSGGERGRSARLSGISTP